MNENKLIDEAKRNFITGCWKRFDEYYKCIENSNIYIYGTGIYGQFLYKALNYIGRGKQIKAFINDFAVGNEILFDTHVFKPSDITIDFGLDVIVVGVQNSERIIDYLKKNNFRYIYADYDQWFYQNNLMYSVYHCIDDSIYNMIPNIEYYYREIYKNESSILQIYDEPLSRQIIENRLLFYKTGDCKYIENTVKNYNQYFQDDYYSIGYNEVYVDVGAFDGDSILSFIDFTGGNYSKILGIEPDNLSYSKLVQSVSKFHDCLMINCATGEHNSTAKFDSKGVLGSSFDQNGKEIEIKKLDDLLSCTHPTLIKMDIEGAELDSLRGVAENIKKYRPKLAVCIYHKPEDIIVIPKYIHSLVPEYKFKVRQHSNTMLETVLYAEVKNE